MSEQNRNDLTAGFWDNQKKQWIVPHSDSAPQTEKLACLEDLPPIARFCVRCDKLLECGLGKKVVFGSNDMSVTDKMLQLDWRPNDKELHAMTLEQLNEVNAAWDVIDSREKIEKYRNLLTAGAWDNDKKAWVTDVLTGADSMTKPRTQGLTAGMWNQQKKCWVAE